MQHKKNRVMNNARLGRFLENAWLMLLTVFIFFQLHFCLFNGIDEQLPTDSSVIGTDTNTATGVINHHHESPFFDNCCSAVFTSEAAICNRLVAQNCL